MRHYHQLTQEERYHITFLSRRGHSIREIARQLGRSPSTISREQKRNATHHDGHYRAQKAHSYAVARRRRSRRNSHFSQGDWMLVNYLLTQEWSPDQIAKTLADKNYLHISHES
jgi:IS30 family transposase